MRLLGSIAIALLGCAAYANAASFLFNTEPLAGTDPNDNVRQILGGEPFISFNPATDVFIFDLSVFNVSDIKFFGGLGATVPAAGVNTIVLQDTPTPFAAPTAANLIAGQITDPGPGFFIYFNSGFGVPRLVYSRDLSDPTADLQILARLTNLSGDSGRAALSTFTSANFADVPEPSSMLLTVVGGLAVFGFARRQRRRYVA